MKSFYFIISFILLSSSIRAQGVWYWQNPIPPQVNELNQVNFFDENSGIVVGDGGLIYITTNGGFTWGINESATIYEIWDLSFINSEIGIMITRYPSQIFITYNGGWNWNQLPNPPGWCDFVSCYLSDSLNIYVAGSEWTSLAPIPTLYYTNDTGSSWNKVQQFNYGYVLYDLIFINDNIGFTVSSDGKIYRTSNRGFNWIQTFEAGVGFRSISFCDSSNGIVVGGSIFNQRIYKTTNSGFTWEETNSPPDYITKLCFYNLEVLFGVGSNYSIYKSIDGGTSWDLLLRLGSGTSNRFNGLSLTDVNHITVAGTAGKIYRSSDSGINWISRTEGSINDLFAICIADQNYEMAVGREGNIQRTINGGATWQTISSGYNKNLNEITSLDSATYILVGGDGLIIKTTDDGTNWFQKPSGTNKQLNSIRMVDGESGFIVGNYGVLLKTSDGGESWQLQIIDSHIDLIDISLLDNSTFLVVGSRYLNNSNYSYILRSTDAGSSWEIVYENINEWFSAVSSMGSQGIIATGGANAYNLLLKSTDRGQSWDNLNCGGPYFQETCTGVSFIDSLNGLVCFESGNIYQTSDGGNSWEFKGDFFQCVGQSLQDIQMLNLNCATAVGWCGTIASNITNHIMPVELVSFTGYCQYGKVTIKWSTISELNNQRFEIERKTISNNSELEWILIGYKLGHGTSTQQNEYTFIDDISNLNAEIVKYRLKQIDYNGSCTYSQVMEIQTSPLSYSLSQNFPNPFNPNTKIKYGLPEVTKVKLTVFDILGREIKTLVNLEKPAGNYEVEFDGTGLPSGVYFYRIETANYSDTKKFVLLK